MAPGARNKFSKYTVLKKELATFLRFLPLPNDYAHGGLCRPLGMPLSMNVLNWWF